MNPKQRLKLKADKLWYLKLIQDECELCDNYAIQVHHFYYKSSYGHLRYDLDNGISLCRGCHFVLHHQDPKKIEDKIFAIEVETGTLLRKKKQLKEKIKYLNSKYGNRWFIVVSKRELTKEYRKYGSCIQRNGVCKKVDNLLETYTQDF